ncbi:hypothetical protein ABTC63_21675, partial [Acinetobacter baumannii]
MDVQCEFDFDKKTLASLESLYIDRGRVTILLEDLPNTLKGLTLRRINLITAGSLIDLSSFETLETFSI